MMAILDWGIGGLGFFKLLHAAQPRVPILYVSDSGSVPYGKLPLDKLAHRVTEIAAIARREGAHHLVVACNAASTVLPSIGITGDVGELRTPHGSVAMTGVISHAVRLVKQMRPHSLGVIGGVRTIRSGLYRKALSSTVKVIKQRVAQPLSAHIEAGALSSAELDADVRQILEPLEDVDALLLACTHYPAITSHFERHLPQARMLDPAMEVVQWVQRNWSLSNRSRAPIFYTTGDGEQMRMAAQKAFGVVIDRVRFLKTSIKEPKAACTQEVSSW